MEERFSYGRFQIYHSLALLRVYSSFPFYSFADQLSHEGGHTTIWNHILYCIPFFVDIVGVGEVNMGKYN